MTVNCTVAGCDNEAPNRTGLCLKHRQRVVQLCSAARVLQDAGFTHVEVGDGETVSIAETLGNRITDLMSPPPAGGKKR